MTCCDHINSLQNFSGITISHFFLLCLHTKKVRDVSFRHQAWLAKISTRSVWRMFLKCFHKANIGKHSMILLISFACEHTERFKNKVGSWRTRSVFHTLIENMSRGPETLALFSPSKGNRTIDPCHHAWHTGGRKYSNNTEMQIQFVYESIFNWIHLGETGLLLTNFWEIMHLLHCMLPEKKAKTDESRNKQLIILDEFSAFSRKLLVRI